MIQQAVRPTVYAVVLAVALGAVGCAPARKESQASQTDSQLVTELIALAAKLAGMTIAGMGLVLDIAQMTTGDTSPHQRDAMERRQLIS